MGSSSKKHKKESKKKKHRSRSRSRSISLGKRDRDRERYVEVDYRDDNRDRDRRHRREKEHGEGRDYRSRSKSRDEERRLRHKVKKHKHRRRDVTIVNDSDESSSDCIEVPLAAPPAPIITQPSPPRDKSSTPENTEGAGDVLSIEESNKIRAKLGLKPLELTSGPLGHSENDKTKNPEGLSVYKDDWGEFLHKPADDLAEKAEVKKILEKIVQKKEKRKIEEKLLKVKTLGESDEEDVDDTRKWIYNMKKKEELRKEAEKRAKLLEEMDEELGSKSEVVKRNLKSKQYRNKDLEGLTVDHDVDDFQEGRSVILTLKDKEVLDEENGDTLVNVNMVDDERYKKNVANKKLNPQSYGYDVYEEQYDEFGNPIERDILGKYNEEIGKKNKKYFTIGESLVEEIEYKRKLLEIKTCLAGKKLETLEDAKITLASDTFSEAEIQAKFKKPKKRIKKLRKKLKADDLLTSAPSNSRDFGSRRHHFLEDDKIPEKKPDLKKIDPDEEEDLQRMLSKARRLKQQDALIQKAIDPEEIKIEIKEESSEDVKETLATNMMLNATAEFCRTLGDIPTYGMAGNRDEDTTEMMDFEIETDQDTVSHQNIHFSEQNLGGTWNSVDPQFETRGLDEVVNISDDELSDVAILDEEPDVGTGIGNALRLAMSKGYLEKEDQNRPSNTKMAHLQAKNYSIEDKSYTEDDKFNRRDRYQAGPIMDFRDKTNFNPNVKLEYIDDNGRILNAKEAFRYLSHKFHGKGPGKNKIEKRLKKLEQESLMKTMSSTDTPLGTLTMLQQKQRETKTAYVVLSGNKQSSMGSISKHK